MSRTTTPTPGMWLRVTPDGRAAPVTVFIDGLSRRTYWGSRLGSGDIKQDDPEGTYYLPISLEILEAAAEMADALTLVYECVAVRAYRAAVAKAVADV